MGFSDFLIRAHPRKSAVRFQVLSASPRLRASAVKFWFSDHPITAIT
jgi:hypothetical protein